MRSLPQGAVLSPILMIYTRTIFDLPENIQAVQFADDIALYVTDSDRKKNKQVLQEALRIMDNNLELLGLHIEPKKTSIMEFNKNGYVDDVNMNLDHAGHQIHNTAETIPRDTHG